MVAAGGARWGRGAMRRTLAAPRHPGGEGGVMRRRCACDGRRGAGGRRLSEEVTRLTISVMPHETGGLQRGCSRSQMPFLSPRGATVR